MLKSFFAAVHGRLDARRRYRKAIAEIEALSESDLLDLGAFQVDLRRTARQEILG